MYFIDIIWNHITYSHQSWSNSTLNFNELNEPIRKEDVWPEHTKWNSNTSNCSVALLHFKESVQEVDKIPTKMMYIWVRQIIFRYQLVTANYVY